MTNHAKATISAHEVRIVDAFERDAHAWLSSADVAQAASVAARTARMHLRRFTVAGLLEVRRVFPGYRYRLRSDASTFSYYMRIVQAREALSGRAA